MNWKPGTPTASKDRWSVPPVLRLLIVVTLRSFNGAIEIRGNKLLLGFERERPRGLPQKLRQLHLLRSGRQREAAEMLGCVSLAAEQTLLFARPQRNADRPPRFDRERIQNPHNLHGNHRACAVIRGARARDPAIEMTTHHHHLVF